MSHVDVFKAEPVSDAPAPPNNSTELSSLETLMKIQIRSAPHRKIAVADILPNPHRDLKTNPIKPERVSELIESIERTGFWDNIVVRQHPTRDSKYELAYGHNRLAALKDKRVIADTITIPVAKLNDWEMYCAMVDENEVQGRPTPQIAFENINTGCEIIERALKRIGEEGSFEEFCEAVGRDVPVGTSPSNKYNTGFEQVRNAFFEGEGLGRQFLIDFLPCGRMRNTTISTVLDARYAETRAEAKARKAAAKKKAAKDKRKSADDETDAERKAKLKEQADAEDAEAAKLEVEAKKIGGRSVSKDVLLMFEGVRMMTDFAEAIKKLGVTKEHHIAAAKHIIAAGVTNERIERELAIWWDKASGAEAKRNKDAETQRKKEKLQKLIKGNDFTSFLLKIASDLKDTEERLKIAIDHADIMDARGRRVVEDKIVPLARLIDRLIERARASLDEPFADTTPAPKMLTHH